MRSEPLTRESLGEVLGIALSPEQVAAATSEPGPGLIVAGAGSGKTTVMAARVVWLVGTGQVQPAGVLGLTFTNKAAAELLQRVRSGLGRLSGQQVGSADDAMVCTYHAYAGQLLREFGMLIGVEPDSELMSPVRQRQLALQVARSGEIDPNGLHTSVPELAAAIVSLDSLLADAQVDVQALLEFDQDLIAALNGRQDQQRIGERMLRTAAARRELATLVQRYRKRKLERELLDFADVVRLCSELARSHEEVGKLLRQRHQAVLLDEYQDTSVGQRVLLQAVFGQGHPVTAVGDPCQAIYGWRGASPHNIDGFGEHFAPEAGGRAGLHTLATNRRSGANILSLANDVAKPLRDIHPDVVPLRPDPAKGSGAVECALLPTVADELDWLVGRLQATGRPWSDIAVLTRTNDSVTEVVAALRGAGIPVQVSGKQGLLALPEVRWVMWALHLAAESTANDALAGLLLGPPWRLGLRDLALLGRRAVELDRRGRQTRADASVAEELLASLSLDAADGPCLLDALHDPGSPDHYPYSPEAKLRMGAAAQLILGWQSRSSMAVPDLIRLIADESGLAVELALGAASGVLGSPEGDGGLVGLIHLARAFDDLERGSDLGDFLAWTRLAGELSDGPAAPPAEQADAVTVMTVHGSKGLEFPVVALPGLVAGGFPSEQSRGTWATSPLALPLELRRDPVPEELLRFPADPSHPRAAEFTSFTNTNRAVDRIEEVRLAYVALTRARELLVLSGHRWGRTQVRPREPSPFLTAAFEAARDGAATIDVWTLPPDDGATNPLAELEPHQRPSAPGADPDWAPVAAAVRAADPRGPAPAQPTTWDRDLQALRAEAAARNAPQLVEGTPDISASQWLARAKDPAGFDLNLVRPVPRPASRLAQAGEQFHAWVADQQGQLAMLEIDDLIEPEDAALWTHQSAWRDAFRASPLDGLTPLAVEHPVSLGIGDEVVRGRIDAVFEVRGEHWVVDWKTGSARQADPLQLAIYAAAWRADRGISAETVVVGCFVFVAQRRLAVYRNLPDAAALVALARGDGPDVEPAELTQWEA